MFKNISENILHPPSGFKCETCTQPPRSRWEVKQFCILISESCYFILRVFHLLLANIQGDHCSEIPQCYTVDIKTKVWSFHAEWHCLKTPPTSPCKTASYFVCKCSKNYIAPKRERGLLKPFIPFQSHQTQSCYFYCVPANNRHKLEQVSNWNLVGS
jgi:hypothetical protein